MVGTPRTHVFAHGVARSVCYKKTQGFGEVFVEVPQEDEWCISCRMRPDSKKRFGTAFSSGAE